ncbi:MAG: NAD-dependent epimerase/dehydratase family protein, partial [Proteobacteria bacterium]|nr:NAD-dependent epimerase/dehydratase family protein [Pseudomonadota bacterium]
MLITGGAGMIGSTIAHLSVAQGAQVTILDAMLPLYGGNRFNLRGILDDIQFVEGDIRDLNLMRRVVPGYDYIFNLAGQVSYVDSNTEPLLDLDINCKGHIQALEACRLENPQARLLFASSRFVYGRIEYNPVDENHPFNCLSIYGIHKLAGEKYYRFYHEAYGLNTVSVRIANPYGPRQQMKHSKYGILNWFVRLALEEKPLTVFGDGQ